MKKSVVLAIAMGVLSFSSIGAMAADVNPTSIVTNAIPSRTEINYDQLPNAVKVNFEGSDFGAWEVEKVEEVTMEEQPREEKTYELTISDGTQSGIIAFDAEGNMVQ